MIAPFIKDKRFVFLIPVLAVIFVLQLVFLPSKVFSAAGDVVINEVAWAGTGASDSDEWIELYNTTGSDIDVTGWTLNATDGTPAITLSGVIPAGGYFLLERSDEDTVKSIIADQIYTGGLGNTGETLELRNVSSELIDSANSDGGDWPGGLNSPETSMERIDPMATDTDSNWGSNNGTTINGTAADDTSIVGTPKAANSLQAEIPSPTPTSQPEPSDSIVINEVAWTGTVFSSNDEWLELYNTSGSEVDITDWTLNATDGTPEITLSGTIPAGGYFLLERSDDDVVMDIVADQFYTGALGDAGESLELRNINAVLVDSANADGDFWPGGDGSNKMSMERVDPAASDSDSNWATNDGNTINGTDAGSNPILGTPKSQNSVQSENPTATPTSDPTATPTESVSPTPMLTDTEPSPTQSPEPTDGPTPPAPLVIGVFGFGQYTKTCTLEYNYRNFGFFMALFPRISCHYTAS
jgi:hypothetical protein